MSERQPVGRVSTAHHGRFRLADGASLTGLVGGLRRGRGDPCMRLSERGCWRATRTPDGPATLALAVTGSDVDATAWGPGGAWALAHVADLLGERDDTVDAFDPPPGLVRDVWRTLRPTIRVGRSLAVAEALVPTVLEQRVTSVAARRSWRFIVGRYGERAPGPVDGLRLPPAPEVLATIPSFVWHRAGVERRRGETIGRAMQRAPRLDEAAAMTIPDAHRRLTAFAGVGAWTANEVAHVALGDPDAVPVGDFHVKNMVSWALAGEPRGTDERMIELLEPYRGHRARALRLIGHAGLGFPRYGPKVEVPAIATL